MASDVRCTVASGAGEVRGLVHGRARGPPRAGIVIAHGRSGTLRSPLVRRVAEAAEAAGMWALRFTFRYAESKGRASRDLSAEEDDLRGAIAYARGEVPESPIFLAGVSMGARVCARASSHEAVAGVIALGYPLHPRFRPEVRNPPEWPLLVKPALFVQGDHDPFCDLNRLREDLLRLPAGHELVVVRDAGHSFEPIGGRRDTFPEVWEPIPRWIESRP